MPKIKKQTPVKKRTVKKQSPKRSGVLGRIGPIEFGDEGIKMSLYGRSGTGKTTVYSTFPGRILVVICAGSMKPGELRSISKKDYHKIDQVVIHEISEIATVLEHAENENYATVALDHCSGLQDMVMMDILDLKEIPTQLSWGTASQNQYGQGTNQMKTLLRSFLNLSCNVVLVAQEREFNTDTESSLIMPYVSSAMMPSVTGWLNPLCDYLCQTYIRPATTEKTMKVGGKEIKKQVETGGVEYCLRVGPDPVYMTRFRIPKEQSKKLPNAIVDPTYAKIKKLIDGVT